MTLVGAIGAICRKCGADEWRIVGTGSQAGKRQCAACQRSHAIQRQREYRARLRKCPEQYAKVLERDRGYGRIRHKTERYRQRHRQYQQRPDVKAKTSTYRQRPEIRSRDNAKRLDRYHADKAPIRFASIRRLYGLTLDQYHAMFEAQGELCAVCGDVLSKPYVDHDHDTGHVRGLLCGPCNSAIGFLKERPSIIRAAANYLERAAERQLKVTA